ncbi:hypothetical protein N8Z73_01360 [bacterium]|nr:hypothetical protein [bacterium]MDC1221796.1 hypothetical protein [Salibacteraceae bacterium]
MTQYLSSVGGTLLGVAAIYNLVDFGEMRMQYLGVMVLVNPLFVVFLLKRGKLKPDGKDHFQTAVLSLFWVVVLSVIHRYL